VKSHTPQRGASIPEVGGDLVDYFDPESDTGALAAVERVIFDRDYRQAREARIHTEFRPRSWVDCAAALIEHLDRLRAGSPAGVGAGEPVIAMPQARGEGVTDVV